VAYETFYLHSCATNAGGEVSLDYLVGKADEHLDKSTLNRILEVQKLPTEKKNFVINMIDMALRDFKVKQAHAS